MVPDAPGEAAHEHGRFRDAQCAAQRGQHREERDRLPQRHARHDGDPGDGQEGSRDCRQVQTFLALDHGQQQRHQRHQREQGLGESSVQPDERVVGEGEGGAEVEQAVEERTGQGPSARGLQVEHGHGRPKEGCGEREPQAGAPQRRKLAVAEPDTDGIAAASTAAVTKAASATRSRSAVMAERYAGPGRVDHGGLGRAGLRFCPQFGDLPTRLVSSWTGLTHRPRLMPSPPGARRGRQHRPCHLRAIPSTPPPVRHGHPRTRTVL
jgi:hypothetical protein